MVFISPSLKKTVSSTDLANLLIEDIYMKREYVKKILGIFIDEKLSQKQLIKILSTKISKSIGILYKSRNVLSKQCLKQRYFSFIHSYVDYTNIAWASTSQSKLERLYRCQKHAARVIYHKDRYTHGSPLLNDMKALNIFKLNISIFFILCINVNKIYPQNKNEYSEMNILFKNFYVEQILVSIAFHIVDPTFGTKQ